MPGPKPNAQIIFNRIHVELLRLRILCETPLQNNVLDNLEKVVLKVMPLWTDKPLKPRIKKSAQNLSLPPFVQGQVAHDRGLSRDDNPHELINADPSSPWSLWDAGWCFRDDNPKTNPGG